MIGHIVVINEQPNLLHENVKKENKVDNNKTIV